MRERHRGAVECVPLIVNCHTGADSFTFDENLALFRHCWTGIPFCHELHRGRALYNTAQTLCFQRECPTLRVNADFSQWQVVHESDDPQAHSDAFLAAIDRAWHIHARVCLGTTCSRSSGAGMLGATWNLSGVVALHSRRAPVTGGEFLTVAPEFGPKPHMPIVACLPQPVADGRDINCWMRRYVSTTLSEILKSRAVFGSNEPICVRLSRGSGIAHD